MTRDEARFKLLAATESRCTESFMNDFLDSAEALGLVGFDEPETPWEKFLAGMKGEGYDPDKNIVIVDIRMVMERAGVVMADRGRLNEQSGYTLPLKPGV